jgi:hypothetical protein
MLEEVAVVLMQYQLVLAVLVVEVMEQSLDLGLQVPVILVGVVVDQGAIILQVLQVDQG